MPDPPLFKIVGPLLEDGVHRFVRLEPVDPDSLVEALAPRVEGVYFDEDATRNRIIAAAQELKEFDGSEFTETQIDQAIADELDAVLPAVWGENRPKQTDVQRSE